MSSRTAAVLALCALSVGVACGCAAGGRLMQRVGDGLTDYSKSSDGILGRAAGVAGGVYTSVGCSLQGDSANADPAKKPCPPAQAASAASAPQ
jgi:hypothetical protein